MRRPPRRTPQVEVLHSLVIEHALLIDRLDRLRRSSSCLDLRSAVDRRLRQLKVLDTACVLEVQDSRRLRLELRNERIGLDGLRCRHVIQAPRP